jgi:hypothetical protein
VKWFKKEKTPKPKSPPFEPATTAQIDSIYHNLSTFVEPDSPEGQKALSIARLSGPWDKKESYSRLSKQQASKVITYLRSLG